ncbi:MAG: carbon starvation CstA 5TM domain-containing protein [Mucinivorans sp.]
MAFFGGTQGLNQAAAAGQTPAIIVDAICNSWLGKFGALIAIIGVVVCPITTGDTAFRSMRLTIADALKFNQKSIKNRLIVSIPIFAVAYLMCHMDFSTIWKYVGIGNQILATITLWTAATYLAKNGKAHWMMSVPATFLSVVCATYFLIAPYKVGGLAINHTISYVLGVTIGLVLLILFMVKIAKNKDNGKQ